MPVFRLQNPHQEYAWGSLDYLQSLLGEPSNQHTPWAGPDKAARLPANHLRVIQRPRKIHQRRSAYSRRRATVWIRPWFWSVASISSAVLGGVRRLSRWHLTAAQTCPGARSKRDSIKSSGCCASMSNLASVSAGKSFRLYVTMTSALLRMAAARTCRSFGSGKVRESIRSS